ncbi:MAG: DUF2666 family protein [Candidatus Diapherotrites archaeon]|nr:DUF2666 family protein [Candidatus Diapherotrites archaeon]
MSEEKYIHFIANYEDWVAVKKLKVEPTTDPVTIMEFLAGLNTSLDNKVESNLRKVVKLDKLDKKIEEFYLGKKDVQKALEFINSRELNSIIKEISEKPDLQSNEIKELEDFCRVYATRKILKNIGMSIDYSQIEIPGMKKLKKMKV